MIEIIKKFKKQLLAGIIFIIAYFPIFNWMWDRWFVADSYYSHGILVPFVTIFFIWQMKDELKAITPKKSRIGIALILCGLFIYLLSSILRIYFTAGFSMLVVLYGMVLLFWGKEIFSKIAFPLAFLVFMVPIPEVAVVNISFRLKLFAAQVATVLLNNMRIPAIRDGSVIKMRTSQVVVDDVCSGLRSLISLTALGSIFAYMMKDKMFKRVLLFLSTIPIAILTNVCRVIILASVSEIWGTEYIEGFIHDATGYMVFGLAFILLYAVGKLLE